MEEKKQEAQTFLIDGVPYQALREPDLRWLRAYGTVFSVFDQQFSGNLGFGVDGPYGKLFIKYAGAYTVNDRERPEQAIYALQNAIPLYERSHPALVRLRGHGPTGEGYAAIFSWVDGQPLRSVPFDSAVRERVRHLPLIHSLKMLDMVFDLHAQLAQDGLIAVDFNDSNVLLDFARDEAIVCDIDLYRQKPAFNDRGRMKGSARFMAPEEYRLNAALDETTTEYNMGALAFAFFGDNDDRSKKTWLASTPLFEVARRATQEKKADRYPSMRAFLEAWREAVGQSRFARDGIVQWEGLVVAEKRKRKM